MSSGVGHTTFVVENLTRQCVVAERVESARDSASRRRGLLGVRTLDADVGLWINPCEAVHTFGMHIPLDVVFLDACLRVKKVSAQLKPNRIAICLTARSVLEIRAGIAARSGLECGDQLSLRKSSSTVSFEIDRFDS